MSKRDDQRLTKVFQQLRKHITQLSPTTHHKLWTWPRIPGQIVHEAMAQFAHDADPGSTIAFCDTTRLQTARAGFLLTDAAFYCRATGGVAKSFRFSDLHSFERRKADATVSVTTTHGELVFSALDVDPPAFAKLVAAIIKAREAGLTEDTVRFIAVQELSQAHRAVYVRAIVSLLRHTAGQRVLSALELVDLHLLMNRVDLTTASRQAVCDELVTDGRPVAELVNEVIAAVSNGAHRMIALSLLKDVATIASSTTDSLSLDLIKLVSDGSGSAITLAQVEVVNAISCIDEAMLSGLADADLQPLATDLADRAAALEIPHASAFLSGSPLGLTALEVASAVTDRGLARVLGAVTLTSADGRLLTLTAEHHHTPGDGVAVAARVSQAIIAARRRVLDTLLSDLGYLTSVLVAACATEPLDRRVLQHTTRCIEMQRQAVVNTVALL